MEDKFYGTGIVVRAGRNVLGGVGLGGRVEAINLVRRLAATVQRLGDEG